jgi:serine/threonine protein kinase
MKALAQNTLIQNRYLVVHLIGKGGMGEVYLAVDQRLGSAVALKRTYFAGDEMLGNAFEREARTLARMRHPVLPKVSDHFGEGEEQYLVMEHIAGDDLAKRLEAAQKPFPVSWVLFWADQLLDALSYLHSHEPPIIHRDIKPQNLKLTDENHIILLDFGLSKITTGQTHISNTGSTGSVVGYTPHYAPMEQIRGIGTSAKSDLYSLSATVYQLMTNVVPDDALSRADAMLNGMPDPIRPPHELNPEIPASVSEVILKGMEVSQEKRYANGREMQKALRRAFTKMQEAMAAQTVAFNLGDVATAEASIASIEETRLMPPDASPIAAEPPVASPAVNGEVDFDATLAFDPVRQAGDSQPGVAEPEIIPSPAETNGTGISMPQIAEEPKDLHDSFVTVIAGSPASAVEIPIHEETPPPAAAALSAAPPKKGSRTFAVLGGLAAFLVLSAGAATAGWYFYRNYYAGAVVTQPSPSPEPSVAETPLPITTEAVVDSNSSTETNTNSTLVESVDNNPGQSEPPSQPQPRTETESNTSRPNPTGPRSNSRPATPPGNKPAPKPKTNPGRTDILQ